LNVAGNINFRWHILDNLNTTLLLSERQTENATYGYSSSKSRISKDNQYAGRAEQGHSKSDHQILEWLINYYYENNGHNIKLLGGYSFQEWTNESFSAWNADFASDALLWNNLGAGTWHSTSKGQVAPMSYKDSNKLIAMFARINYDFDGKYFMTASLRRDGSSKFGVNNKWGLFPGISAGWIISEMDFFNKDNFLNSLKLRGSYGSTGRQEISSLLSIPAYSTHGKYNMGQGGWVQSYGPSGNINPDLKWEVAHIVNIGVDITLLSDRLSISFDAYQKDTKDLLFQTPVSKPPNLYGTTWSNIGSMQNRGIEAMINWDISTSGGLSYNTTIVASYAKSKMKKITNRIEGSDAGNTYIDLYHLPAPGIPGPIVRLEEGEEIGNFHMYKHAGIDEDGDFLIYNKEGETIKSTEKVLDDKQYVGNGIPDVEFSWDNTFRYKNFDLSIYFKGALFWDVVNLHQMYFGLQNASGNVLQDAYIKNKDIKSEKESSSYFMERGDYLNLRNLTFGYTINPKSKYMQSIRTYITGRNLFTVTKFTGLDPTQLEVNGLTPGVQGLDFYPVTTTLSLGVQIKF